MAIYNGLKLCNFRIVQCFQVAIPAYGYAYRTHGLPQVGTLVGAGRLVGWVVVDGMSKHLLNKEQSSNVIILNFTT